MLQFVNWQFVNFLNLEKKSNRHWSKSDPGKTGNGCNVIVRVFRNYFIIAVCIYRLVMISIDLSETAQNVHWKSEITSNTKLSPRKIFSEKNFLEKKFYREKIFFRKKFSDFVSDWILYRTEFCLVLYFVCNHLI